MMLRLSVLIGVCGATWSCAHAPKCDFTQPLGECTASVETSGSALIAMSDMCSEVDVTIDGRPRTLRVSRRPAYISESQSDVEIVACRAYSAQVESLQTTH
jgi:hypothetical protein